MIKESCTKKHGVYICMCNRCFVVMHSYICNRTSQQHIWHHSSNNMVENCLKWLVMKTAFIVEYHIKCLEHKKSTAQYVVWYPAWKTLTRRFFTYLISGWNKLTIVEQICHVSTPGTWATHVEILATASVFEVPVYYWHKIHKGIEYK